MTVTLLGDGIGVLGLHSLTEGFGWEGTVLTWSGTLPFGSGQGSLWAGDSDSLGGATAAAQQVLRAGAGLGF